MRFGVQLLSVLLALGVASANSDGAEVQLVRRSSVITSNGTLDIVGFEQQLSFMNRKYATSLENYLRNTGKKHPLLSAVFDTFKRSNTGSVPLRDISNEMLWGGEMTFGSQTFTVDFDTGSGDTLVNPTAYRPWRSRTSVNTLIPFYTSYGDGTAASGIVYTDNMRVGGLQGNAVAIGVSTLPFITGSEGREYAGISGMSFPSVATFPKQYPPFFIKLMQEKVVKKGVFQFTLRSGSGSQLFLGGVDKRQYKGDLSYVRVNPANGFWAAPAQVNGVDITAIVDTGSTVISGPQDQVQRVVNSIPGLTAFQQGSNTMYAFDCNTTPNIVVHIAGRDFKLGHAETRYGQLTGQQCILSIVGQTHSAMNAWVLGDSFLQGVTAVFDMDENRMGFAEHA